MATHFLAVNDLGSKTWERLIQDSFNFSLNKIAIPQKTRHVASLFLEASTRTALSFSMAAQNLNCFSHTLHAVHSSISKGETLVDTLLNFEAMGLHAAIVRLKDEGLLKSCAEKLTTMSLICAGEGKISHPSQALLDACTIYEHFNKLHGFKILFLGDVEHSRVFVSNTQWMNWYDNQIYYLSPQSEHMVDFNKNKKLTDSLDQVIGEFDIIVLLRPQIERHSEKLTLENYHPLFGITADRFKKIKPNAIIMHPGPLYRNVEIVSELLTSPCVKIYRQVHWGIFARMSIYSYVMNENKHE